VAGVSAGSLAHEDRRAAQGGPGVLRRRAVAQPAKLALAGLVVAGAVLRFHGLASQGFWFDEANTALLVHLSPGKMLGLIPQSESTPPLYYLVAWVWARVFGSAEAGLRSLSALAGVLVIPVAYATAAKVISRRAAVIAAALTASSPFLVWYSQEARSYELLVLITATALLAFAYSLQNPSRRALGAWMIASGLALATHYYAILAIAPQAAWLLASHRRHPAVRIAVAAVALCGLALIPLALSENATGNAAWIGAAPLGDRLRQIVPLFVIGTGSPLHAVLEPLAAVLALGGVGMLTMADRGQRRGPLLAGGLAAAGLALNLVLVAFGVDDLIARNVIALWLPAALVVAGGLALPRAGAAGIAIAVALCAIGLVADIGVAAEPSLQRPDWRPVARALGPLPADSSGRVLLIQHYRDLLPLSLYVSRLRVMGRRATVDELDVISIRSPSEALCWWGSACNLIPSTMQTSYPIAGFHVVSVRHVQQFTILRMASGRPVTLTRDAVSRALTTTRLRHDDLLLQRP
jgi:mannosyltransferase